MQELFRPLRAAFVFGGLLLGLIGSFGAHAQSDYTKTKYPVVLVHGIFGFDSIGPIDYFYGLPAALKAGGTQVFVADVSAVHANEMRGEQLIKQLEDLRAKTGAQKFNLLAHSQGGLASRYVASVRPDLVASVTTASTPHTGSKVADGVKALTGFTGTTGLAASMVEALGKVIGFISGSKNPQDALANLASTTSEGMAAFNSRHPKGAPTTSCGQGPEVAGGIRYYSLGGTSVLTNVLDPLDGALVTLSVFFGFEASDGVVGRCSSHWGMVLRDNYSWNHIDAQNHSFGLRGLFSSDPNAVYRAQVNRLKNVGV